MGRLRMRPLTSSAAASRSMRVRSSASAPRAPAPASTSAILTARCWNSFPTTPKAETPHAPFARSKHPPRRSPGTAGRWRRTPSHRHAATFPAAQGDRWFTGRSSETFRPHGGLYLPAHRRAGAIHAGRLGPDSRGARLHAAIVRLSGPPCRAQGASGGAGARTPQSGGSRAPLAEHRRLGVARVLALSTQDSAYQREAVERLHLPFP